MAREIRTLKLLQDLLFIYLQPSANHITFSFKVTVWFLQLGPVTVGSDITCDMSVDSSY